ncbi:hypothetical protein SRHO_G00240180 [Serrasalmus rhombeus]
MPAPEPQLHSASTCQSATGAAEDLSVPPEAYEVPALYTYFAMKRMNNFLSGFQPCARLPLLFSATCIIRSMSVWQAGSFLVGWCNVVER